MSLQTAIQQAVPSAERHSYPQEHIGAAAARRLLGECLVFTIIRNPWCIFESHWRWVQRFRGTLGVVGPADVQYGLDAESAMTFSESVVNCIKYNTLASDGGFHSRYCDSETIVFRYEDAPWREISKLVGCELQVGRENEGTGDAPAWDGWCAELVASYCRDDITRYGYLFSGRLTDSLIC
jgi:hypothetical protein